jgi:hypothetical protein
MSGIAPSYHSLLSGNNLHQAFKKNLQLQSQERAVSPDGTLAAVLWQQDLWIFCVDGEGAYKIALPKFNNEIGSFYRETRSFPSWSPDSKQMIMNNNGDLLLINIVGKKVKIIKPQVAFIDNKIDITTKDHETTIPPYEFGDAYWNANGDIYYTAFVDNTVELRQLNPSTNHDKIIKTSNYLLNINSGDPSGKWLVISESARGNARLKNKDPYFYKRYLLNTQTNKELELKDDDLNTIVWSPTGVSVALSTPSWENSPNLQGLPATVLNIETKQSINITNVIGRILENKGIQLKNKALVVEIKDFVDDANLLIKTTMPSSNNNVVSRQINGILDLKNNNLNILQDYKESFYSNFKGGSVSPLQVIGR